MSVLHCNERLTQKLLNLDQRNTSKMPKTVILKLIRKFISMKFEAQASI